MTPIKYKLVSMEVIQSDITPKNYDANKSISINNTFSFGINDDDNTIFRIIHTLILHSEGKNFVELTLRTFIYLAEESVKELTKGNKIEIPRDFLVQCGSISYGSMRGVLVEEAKKAGLPNIVLPPYYVDTLIKESLVVEM